MKILLHVCCGVCAAGVVESLRKEGHLVTGFFYNPNIFPIQEYIDRLNAARKVAHHMGFELIEGDNDHESWRELVKGYEEEPEGGARCALCFARRLKKTCEVFERGGYDVFTTTLTVSPHKNESVVNRIGIDLAGSNFLKADFKKKNGFKRSMELAEELCLYRQHYCGCEFSYREKS